MSLILTQLGTDNFNRANVNPLTAPWALDLAGDPGLQIVSDVCESTEQAFSAQIYDYAEGTPNDQYCSFTVGNSFADFFECWVRLIDNGNPLNELNVGYWFYVNVVGAWDILDEANNTFLANGNVSLSAGSVFTFAVVGTTLYLLFNGTQIASVTNTAHSSGVTALGIYGSPEFGSGQITNFAMGSASVSTYSISGNAGAAGANVAYSGTASGSVTADGSGNYTIGGLANGGYTLTPSLAGRVFNPASRNVTVSGANLTGVNFTDGSVASTDGQQVTILEPGYGYPVGSTPTLSYQVAQQLIALGVASLIGPPQSDGQQVQITGLCDYALGSMPVLAYQVAQRLIAAGKAVAV